MRSGEDEAAAAAALHQLVAERPQMGFGAQVRAVETVGGVLTDLVELAERLPVPPGQAEAAARILDRLAEEIAEAAGLVRAAAHDGPAGPER
jgi:hypothetical protein